MLTRLITLVFVCIAGYFLYWCAGVLPALGPLNQILSFLIILVFGCWVIFLLYKIVTMIPAMIKKTGGG